MKIYTKTGDKGFTSLIGGKRVAKHELKIEAYGTVDELNSYLGLIISLHQHAQQSEHLKAIQVLLFNIGSILANDVEASFVKLPAVLESDINLLESEIDKMNTFLPQLKHFVLPGGATLAAHCHIARCICRRAERLVVKLATQEDIDDKVTIYLNRLSDYLFIFARKVNRDSNIEENKWIPQV